MEGTREQISNKQIVVCSHQVMSGGLRSILPASLIAVVLMVGAAALNGKYAVVGTVLNLLLYPAITLGMTRLLLRAWRGEPTGARELFWFYTGKERLLLALKAGVVAVLLGGNAANLLTYGLRDLIVELLQRPTPAPAPEGGQLTGYLQALEGGSAAASGVTQELLLLVNVAASIGYIALTFMMMRLTLVAVVEWADGRSLEFIATLRRSWRLSKGLVLRTIWLSVRATWVVYLMLCVGTVAAAILLPKGSMNRVSVAVPILAFAALVYILPLVRLPGVGLVAELYLNTASPEDAAEPPDEEAEWEEAAEREEELLPEATSPEGVAEREEEPLPEAASLEETAEREEEPLPEATSPEGVAEREEENSAPQAAPQEDEAGCSGE